VTEHLDVDHYDRTLCSVKPKFHYADFPKLPVGEVGVMEFNWTSRVCRGLVADVTGKSA